MVTLGLTVVGGTGTATAQGAAVPVPSPGGKFVKVEPHRILDTRSAVGVPAAGKVKGGASIRVPVGLPAGDVKAVVLNVTVTEPSEDSHLTVYPDWTTLPTASNLNFTAGQTVPNAVTVPVVNGYVDFFNNSGSTHVVADLAGYYTDSQAITGSTYVPLSPARILDTRPNGAVGEGVTRNLKVAGAGGVPAAGATSVVLNVTVTDTTADSFLTVFPHGITRPSTSSLNWTPGQTVPNLVTVPLGADGSVDLFNHIGSTQVVVDVFGFYQAAPNGASYSATGPKRMVDTRSSGSFHTLDADGTMNLPVATGGLGTTKVAAVVLNVTVTNPTADSFLTVFPGNGTGRPTTSNLNFRPGQTIPNMVIVPVDDSGMINFYNHLGTVDVVVDIFGYFTLPEGGPTALGLGTNGPNVACAATAPGNWLPNALSDVQVFATPPGLAGNGASPWLQVVLTAPDGSTSSYSSTPVADHFQTGVSIGKPTSGSYSFYTYETDGTRVSAPSSTCYFRVDADSLITGVTVASNGVDGQIFMQQPLTFTFGATSTGSTEGRTIASFHYALDSSTAPDTLVPATNGTAQAVINSGSWGTHSVYVWAVTASGWRSQPTIYTFYTRWQ